MPYDAPDLANMSAVDILTLADGRDLPPVQDWHPDAACDSLMRIDAAGRWFHDGGAIRRPAMVRAFSRLLRREEDGRYALVLPHEKQWIAVEDAPFQAVEMRLAGTGKAAELTFRLNTDDLVVAGPDHRLRIGGTENDPRVYLHVRSTLEARIGRAVYYELADIALAANRAENGPAGGAAPGVWSGGCFFALGPPA